jgi:exocyst complex component 4
MFVVPVVEYEKSLTTNEPARALSLEVHSRPQRLFRFINDLMVRANQAPADASEELDLAASRRLSGTSAPAAFAGGPSASGNPESDSFGYIETLLESLAVLGELGNGLDIVAQRLPVEIYSVLEATLDEVNERSEFNKRMSLLAPGSTGRPSSVFGGSSRNLTFSSLRLASLESSAKEVDQETLRDLFWTLYSKLDAVLQGLRVVYEVANRIGSVSR